MSLGENDVGAMSDNLKGLIYRLASLEVDLIFVRLNDEPNLQVESVSKGTIGPCFFYGMSPLVSKLDVSKLSNTMCLSALYSVASTEQKTDVFNDPFWEKSTLSESARSEYAKERNSSDFHMLVDRKFCVCGPEVNVIRDLVRTSGTTNIIYTI